MSELTQSVTVNKPVKKLVTTESNVQNNKEKEKET